MNLLPPFAGHHLIVAGATRSGKSHTLSYLLAHYQQVVVCDPHYTPGSWPEHCKIVGKGRDYPSIEIALQNAHKVMCDRYRIRSVQNREFSPIVIAMDEMPSICANIKGASTILKEIAREGRKVRVFIVIGSQSTLVKDLDIAGSSTTRENFVIIKLPTLPPDVPNDTERIAEVEIGEEVKQYVVPREIPIIQRKNEQETFLEDAHVRKIEPSPKVAMIIVGIVFLIFIALAVWLSTI